MLERLALATLLLVASVPASAQELVVLVRHAEKVDESEDPPLSPAGQARARALAGKLRDARLSAIYASERRRARDTAAPVAEALALKVRTHPPKDARGLVARIREEQPTGRVLVVGHSNTLPDIAAALGVKDALTIGDDDYENVLIVVPRKGAPPVLLRLRM